MKLWRLLPFTQAHGKYSCDGVTSCHMALEVIVTTGTRGTRYGEVMREGAVTTCRSDIHGLPGTGRMIVLHREETPSRVTRVDGVKCPAAAPLPGPTQYGRPFQCI